MSDQAGDVQAIGGMSERPQYPRVWDYQRQNVQYTESQINQLAYQIARPKELQIPERRLWKEFKRILGLNL